MPSKHTTPGKPGHKAVTTSFVSKSASGNKMPMEVCSDEVSGVNQNPLSMLSLNDMPLDVLVKIMSYLSFNDLFMMELVSKRMHAVTLTAWKQVTAISTRTKYYSSRSDFGSKHHCAEDIDDRTAKAVLKRGVIKYLAAGAQMGICRLTSDILTMVRFMPNLRRIHLEMIALTNSNITALAIYCNQLTHVTFIRCFDIVKVDRALGMLFSNCNHLTYLYLSVYDDHCLDFECFLLLPPTLEHLYINVPEIETAIISILETCPNLLSFNFTGNIDDVDDVNLVLRHLPKVRFMHVFAICPFEGTATIDFSHNPDVEVLTGFDVDYIGSDAVRTLSSCKKLRSLFLKWNMHEAHDADDFRSLAECKSLRVLYLKGNFDLRDVSYVVNSCGVQYLRLFHFGVLTRAEIAKFINETPTLKGHFWVKTPALFDFTEFVDQYFDDQFECVKESDGVIDPDRPLFHSPLTNAHTKAFFVRQSELEKATFESAGFDETVEKIMEFGILP